MASRGVARVKSPYLRELQALRSEVAALRDLVSRGAGAPSPTHLTAAQVALRLNVSERTLSRWASEGSGPPYIRVATGRLYPEGEFAAWLEAQRVYRNTAQEAAQKEGKP